MNNSALMMGMAAFWVMNRQAKPTAGKVAPERKPDADEQDVTGVSIVTGTTVVEKPVQVPLEHMRNGLHDKFQRREHDMDLMDLQRSATAIGTPGQLELPFDPAGQCPLNALVPVPCGVGCDKPHVGQMETLRLRAHCTNA